MQSHELGFFLTIIIMRDYTKFDFTVDEGKERLNLSRFLAIKIQVSTA